MAIGSCLPASKEVRPGRLKRACENQVCESVGDQLKRVVHAGVMCLDFHREQPHLLAAGLKDGTVCIFDLRSEVQSGMRSDAALRNHYGAVCIQAPVFRTACLFVSQQHLPWRKL